MSTETFWRVNHDMDWAYDLYSKFARGGDDERMFFLLLEGDPWSKSRPKFARRGKYTQTYQPRDDRDAEQRLASRIKSTNPEAFRGNVMLACRFYRSNFQRIDTDNLLKHICDSANGLLWKDDSQVTFALGEVHYDRDRPRTIIMAANHASTLLRGDDLRRECEGCGNLFMPAAGRKNGPMVQRFCSQACHLEVRRKLRDPIQCKSCGNDFHPKQSKQTMCSPECRADWMRNRPRPKKQVSNCTTCGKQLSHSRGGRCRECWRADPRVVPTREELEFLRLDPGEQGTLL